MPDATAEREPTGSVPIATLDQHCLEIDRVATELGKRGLIDLADDLRLAVRNLRRPPR